ncbi:MAG TPA: peptidase [Xanthomonadaceae bacterium]|nr:peptidase [Xanthomonadaceae bacterium]
MKRLIPLLLAASLLAGCATTTSPTGRRQYVGGVSQSQLDQMGAQAFAEAKAKEKIDTDPKQNAYVRCVVDALVARLPAQWRSTRWETALFVDAEPNAFALPGGKVGVNTGIFTVARNQDELAAVLGHEIGHVVSHHHDERITRQMNAQIGVSLLGALLGSGYGQLGSEGAGVYLLRNTREQEAEADVVGQRLMADAGFDPSKAVDLWQNMMAAGGARQPQWLSTHPDPENRIRTLRNDAPALMPVYAAARQAGRVPHCR